MKILNSTVIFRPGGFRFVSGRSVVCANGQLAAESLTAESFQPVKTETGEN